MCNISNHFVLCVCLLARVCMCVFVSSSGVYVCVSICRSCVCVWVIKGAGSLGCWKRRLLLLWKRRIPISGSEQWAVNRHCAWCGAREVWALTSLGSSSGSSSSSSFQYRTGCSKCRRSWWASCSVLCIVLYSTVFFTKRASSSSPSSCTIAVASSSFPLVLHLSSLPPFVNAATSNEVQQRQETEIDQLDSMFELQSSSSTAANGRWLSFVL